MQRPMEKGKETNERRRDGAVVRQRVKGEKWEGEKRTPKKEEHERRMNKGRGTAPRMERLVG